MSRGTPLVIYVSRWFDRRRGTAIALISSGQYVAGVIWPTAFERLIAGLGWRVTYLGYAGVVLLGVLLLAILFLRPIPGAFGAGAKGVAIPVSRTSVLGLRPNAGQAIICATCSPRPRRRGASRWCCSPR